MLGIYYLIHDKNIFDRSQRKCVLGITKDDFLQQLIEREVPDHHICWIEECRTPLRLMEGTVEQAKAWINLHMPETFKGALR